MAVFQNVGFSLVKKFPNLSVNWEKTWSYEFPRISEIGNARFYQVWDFLGNLGVYQENPKFLPSLGTGDFFLWELLKDTAGQIKQANGTSTEQQMKEIKKLKFQEPHKLR